MLQLELTFWISQMAAINPVKRRRKVSNRDEARDSKLYSIFLILIPFRFSWQIWYATKQLPTTGEFLLQLERCIEGPKIAPKTKNCLKLIIFKFKIFGSSWFWNTHLHLMPQCTVNNRTDLVTFFVSFSQSCFGMCPAVIWKHFTVINYWSFWNF